ncbi:unnamed protein product [Allacma fusca]|uniref:Uncharacterized protein n=1 Tax=Allacma fusca TaxID=39272 RepID=A0A8J2PKV1_9HEXA|nr:unnamed protein product [Allacma fusca]
MSGCKTLDIPCNLGLQLHAANTRFEFQELIGALICTASFTRPDIACLVQYLARVFAEYEKYLWESAEVIPRYLQGSKHLDLMYTSAQENTIVGYVDADYGSDIPTHIVAVVSHGVGLAGCEISRIYALEYKPDKLKQALDQLEQDVHVSIKYHGTAPRDFTLNLKSSRRQTRKFALQTNRQS